MSVEADNDRRAERTVQIGGTEVCGCFEFTIHQRPDLLDWDPRNLGNSQEVAAAKVVITRLFYIDTRDQLISLLLLKQIKEEKGKVNKEEARILCYPMYELSIYIILR